jgi:hypothetical protein
MIFGIDTANHPKGRAVFASLPLHLQHVSQKNYCMKKTILTYGLISGGIAAVLMTATALYFNNATDYRNGELFGYAGILLSMVFVYLGVRAFRDNYTDGALSFGTAFKVGILITLISCACYVIAWLVVYQTLMPDFMDRYIEQALAQMKLNGATVEQIRQEAAKMEEFKTMYKNPLVRVAFTFLEPFPVGVLVTLLSSAILRRRVS